MGDTVAIARTYSPISVDLWGKEFETVDLTRSGAKKASALEAKLTDADESDVDGAVGLILELLDLKLVSSGTTKTKASTQIKRKWDGDELSLSDLMDFLRRLGEAEAARPT